MTNEKIETDKLLAQNRELLEWKRMLMLILKHSSEITFLDNVKDILNALAEVSADILQADRCTVFLLDVEKNELISWVAQGISHNEIRFSADKGIAGAVAKTNKAIIIDDAYSDPRFNPEIDLLTGYRTNTILCVPMKDLQGDVIGVFQVINKLYGKTFSARDLEIISLFAYQAASAIESTKLYEEEKKTFDSFINTLAETIDARDPMTAGHSRRVCGYSSLIGEKMGYEKEAMNLLRYSSLLHDLGKIGVKEAVLTKPESLTKEEYKHIQTHTSVTRRILEHTYFKAKYREIPLIASSHHENMDGSGYPRGLSGLQIPEMSRIMAVADVFDALTYRRHYRNPMSMEKVLEELLAEVGNKFDSRCIAAMMQVCVYDVLEVMFEGLGLQLPAGLRYKFNNMTLQNLYDAYKKHDKQEIIIEFERYYPVRIDEDDEK